MYGDGGRDRRRTCCGSCCTLLVSLGFLLLIYWAIFQPHQIRATVDAATLSNLTVVSNASSSTTDPATVSYHVAANLSLYNPSKRVGIYYDTLAARLLYRGAPLSAAAADASPAEFYQRRRTAQLVGLVFDSGKDGGVALPAGLAAQLEAEAAGAARALGLELDLALRVRYVFGAVKIRQKPRVRCALSVPVPPAPGGVGILGSGGRCSVKY
ncbi:hypothetical protein BS78_08G031300 [Paspalum vaginatum]|nr:hypothetical protein BS78_08G031300 [Paspalum vaginatum]